MANNNKNTYGIVYLLVAATVVSLFFYLVNKVDVLKVRNDVIDNISDDIANNGKVDNVSKANLLEESGWLWNNTKYLDRGVSFPLQGKIFNLILKADNTFYSTTDCNNLSGKYNFQDLKINFYDIVRTEMYCEDMQEEKYLKDLENVESYSINKNDILILNMKDGAGKMYFNLKSFEK